MSAQLTLNLALRADATFQNFNADGNAVLMQHLSHAHEKVSIENFYYLWGEPGVGKSHLLQAKINQLGNAGLQVCYLPMCDFECYDPSMLQDLEQLDCVCLDDIQAIAGKPAWEEAVFYLYNRMKQAQKLLIVSARCAPPQLDIKLPDLKSRLAWGYIFQVSTLCDEQKAKTLQTHAHERGMLLSDSVVNYIITHSSRNFSQLSNILDKLDHASLVEKRRITIPFIKSLDLS